MCKAYNVPFLETDVTGPVTVCPTSCSSECIVAVQTKIKLYILYIFCQLLYPGFVEKYVFL